MSTNAEPVWDEPPADSGELILADLLDRALDWLFQGQIPSAKSLLLGAPEWIDLGQRLLNDLCALMGVGEALRDQSRLLESDVLALSAEDATASPDETAPPDPFPGEFRLTRRLGAGAFGTVWLADDLHLGRRVALKTVRPRGLPDLAVPRLERLRAEARVLASMRHRNVVQVHAWRESPAGDHYLVLQYVPGGSLADRVAQEGPLPWPLAARYVADVADGLIEVHARGIVHRDVKPANILWDPETDEALLTDFGVSARLVDPGQAAGTPFYMPPEAFDGVAGPTQDVYALAASLFWLTTGSVPFPGPGSTGIVAQARRGLPDPDSRCIDLPAPLERLVRDGLAAEPSRRPSLRDFAAALRAALNHLLADSLLAPADAARPRPARVHLTVSRRVDRHSFVPIAASRPAAEGVLRDIRLVPPEPDRVQAVTGDRLRIEAEADHGGFLTVFNVGPTGNLNCLCPAEGARGPVAVELHRPLPVLDVELTPPAGRERLFAIWTREPLPLNVDDMRRIAGGGELPVTPPYRATRDMVLVQETVLRLGPDDWQAAVVELEHRPG